MAGEIDICNRALSKLGQISIISLDDNIRSAKECKKAYPIVRDMVLRAHPWNCTIVRAVLAPLSTSPEFEYTYQYNLPSDCIRVLKVDTDYDWLIEGRKIVTDEGTVLNVRYQKKEEDPGQYDPMLIELIASRLAYELAEPLTQSNTKKDILFRDFTTLLTETKKIDAQEGSASTFKEDSWITVRL